MDITRDRPGNIGRKDKQAIGRSGKGKITFSCANGSVSNGSSAADARGKVTGYKVEYSAMVAVEAKPLFREA